MPGIKTAIPCQVPAMSLTDAIPIVSIVLLVLIPAVLAIFLFYRHKRASLEWLHKERMSALEQGLDLPPLPAETARPDGPPAKQYLLRGLICLLIGLALMTALGCNISPKSALWGAPLAAFGVAYLVYYAMMRSKAGPGK